MTASTNAPSSTARSRILDTATRLFYAHGLRAVGVDTIIAESGVAKATFYKHFPAKDDLIAAYLDVVDEMWPENKEAPVTFVVIPEYVARSWWERLLYNQSANRLRRALLGRPHTVVVNVPYRREREEVTTAA